MRKICVLFLHKLNKFIKINTNNRCNKEQNRINYQRENISICFCMKFNIFIHHTNRFSRARIRIKTFRWFLWLNPMHCEKRIFIDKISYGQMGRKRINIPEIWCDHKMGELGKIYAISSRRLWSMWNRWKRYQIYLSWLDAMKSSFIANLSTPLRWINSTLTAPIQFKCSEKMLQLGILLLPLKYHKHYICIWYTFLLPQNAEIFLL